MCLSNLHIPWNNGAWRDIFKSVWFGDNYDSALIAGRSEYRYFDSDWKFEELEYILHKPEQSDSGGIGGYRVFWQDGHAHWKLHGI